MIQKLRTLVAAFAVYLSVCGLFGFSMFILEESQQVLMFSSWNSIDCGDWETVKASCDIMAGFNKTLRIINYIGGWINPLAFISYSAYARATDQYIKALRAKTLAHAPDLFVGEQVSLSFVPRSSRKIQDYWELTSGKIKVLARSGEISGQTASGVLALVDGQLVLDAR